MPVCCPDLEFERSAFVFQIIEMFVISSSEDTSCSRFCSQVVIAVRFCVLCFAVISWINTCRVARLIVSHLISSHPSVDKLRHQESLWREDPQSGGNPHHNSHMNRLKDSSDVPEARL